MRTPQCLKRFLRPYICIMELPISRPGSGNLLLGLTSVVGLIGGAYLLQCGAQQLLGSWGAQISEKKGDKSDCKYAQSWLGFRYIDLFDGGYMQGDYSTYVMNEFV
ncbi:hypothetical protein M5D96_010035 [Drosophila gunungcola]|uniref:Uncharacterized protein n=1 Tax=Drosophila gunungcola TaxID=103775 RepID=A0A9P9YHV9_9MUSC|nr:hypothetical protein M5D96_010035 [Drosophila gunungcola]